MSKACRKFKTPVTGGNVSFYNQSSVNGVEIPVFPTPTIGMLGIVEDKKNITSLAFENSSDLIYLLGESKNDISSSEYLFSYHKIKESSAPDFNLDIELELQKDLYSLITKDLIISAHDISDGGLFISLLESSMVNDKGFSIKCSSALRKDAFLFGECPSRVIVSVKASLKNEFENYINSLQTKSLLLGEVIDNNISIDGVSFGLTSDFSEIYNTSLSEKLK